MKRSISFTDLENVFSTMKISPLRRLDDCVLVTRAPERNIQRVKIPRKETKIDKNINDIKAPLYPFTDNFVMSKSEEMKSVEGGSEYLHVSIISFNFEDNDILQTSNNMHDLKSKSNRHEALQYQMPFVM
mmetsp:Transcript_33930/g.34567  ORF Transcript_33930/g.34567 Transcript_33930/m.34567 type:complete len:130 (+) Transcript_33930:105-494(+)